MTTTPTELEFDVVIIGGGFAGVYCARQLARELGERAAERVALIADQNIMVFQPMLAEVAGSSLSPRHVVNPIRRLCRGVTTLRSTVADIEYLERRIRLEPGELTCSVSVRFQHLVLAVGGVVDLSRVPGMPEHALLMKNVGDAMRLRAVVIDRFEEANLVTDAEVHRRLLSFVIVGGGYSGVETAGQVFDLGVEMLRSYPRIANGTLKVTLVHSGPHLLPEVSRSLGEYCENSLRSRGVELVLNTRVSAITASRVHLADGKSINSHTVVSTVGNAPHPLVLGLCKGGFLECEKGRILTEATLRVQGRENLWAAGDCAAVPLYGTPHITSEGDARLKAPGKLGPSPFDARRYCPSTAQFAMRQGALLAKNLALTLGKSDALDPFTFTGLGELAAIGHRSAVAEILGMKFQGFFAWWLWRSIYLIKLPGLERKLRVMIDWTLDLFFPRDITLLQPAPTRLLAEMHLEAGDQVFRAGEPARSLYVVKVGKLELRDGKGAVLRTVGAGEQLGKQTLREGRAWAFEAVVVEPTTLVAVSARVFDAISVAGVAPREVSSHDAALPPDGVATGDGALLVGRD